MRGSLSGGLVFYISARPHASTFGLNPITIIVTIYDPIAGTCDVLLEANEYIQSISKGVTVSVYPDFGHLRLPDGIRGRMDSGGDISMGGRKFDLGLSRLLSALVLPGW